MIGCGVGPCKKRMKFQPKAKTTTTILIWGCLLLLFSFPFWLVANNGHRGNHTTPEKFSAMMKRGPRQRMRWIQDAGPGTLTTRTHNRIHTHRRKKQHTGPCCRRRAAGPPPKQRSNHLSPLADDDADASPAAHTKHQQQRRQAPAAASKRQAWGSSSRARSCWRRRSRRRPTPPPRSSSSSSSASSPRPTVRPCTFACLPAWASLGLGCERVWVGRCMNRHRHDRPTIQPLTTTNNATGVFNDQGVSDLGRLVYYITLPSLLFVNILREVRLGSPGPPNPIQSNPTR